MEKRHRIVEYQGVPLHLTIEEYVELKNLALDDPAEADKKAKEYLKREQENTS